MYKIIHKQVVAQDIKKIDITAPAIAVRALPGQFVMVTPVAGGESIPMTIIDSDERRSVISLLVHEVGVTTRKLGDLSIGESLYQMVGPLGRGAEMDKYGLVICVATGIGAAQILPICRGLKKKGNKVIGKRRFTGTTGADERHHAAGGNRQLNILQHFLVAVGKTDVVEANRRTCCAQRHGLRRFMHGILHGQQIKDPLAGGARLLKLALKTDEIFDGAIHEKHSDGKGNEVDGMVTRLKGEVEAHQGDADGGEKFIQRTGNFLRADDSHTVADKALGNLLELLNRLFFKVIGLDDAVAGEGFVHHG